MTVADGYSVFEPLAEARAGPGTAMNSVAWSTAWPIGVGPCARYGTSTRVPAIGASHTSMSRWFARYLIAAREGIKPATGEKYAAQTTTGPAQPLSALTSSIRLKANCIS